MLVTAWNSAGACVNDTTIGTMIWQANVDLGTALVGTEVSSDNSIFAENGFGINATSNYLRCTNFGFTIAQIPVGSSIDGFEIEVRQLRAAVSITIVNTIIRLVNNNVIVGNDFGAPGNWTTTETAVIYGNSTQRGGQTWSVSDVTASNFGVGLAYVNGPTGLVAPTAHAFVDQVRIRVHYTEGGALFDPRIASQFMTFFS